MGDTGTTTQEASRIFRDWSEVEYIEAAAALLLTLALIALIKFVVPKVASWLPDRFRFWILPWEPILRIVVLVAAVLYIAPLFIRPTAENLLAIGGAMAVALGFAFKDYASSLIAGVVALYERPYRSGDWVRIGDTYGEVQELGLRSVQVRTPNDDMVSIPHLEMWTSAIYNANSGERELMCVANFYLTPEHDGALVREALTDVAWSSPYIHLGRPVKVVAAAEPWGVHYRLKAYPIEGRDQFQFTTDLTLRGLALLRGHGIKLCSVSPVGAAVS